MIYMLYITYEILLLKTLPILCFGRLSFFSDDLMDVQDPFQSSFLYVYQFKFVNFLERAGFFL